MAATSKTRNVSIGQVFGRLTIVSDPFRNPGGSKRRVFCQCSCGRITEKNLSDILAGHTTSCGCYARERSSARERTHGMTSSPEFNTWKGIKQRCYNPNHTHYESYGGRGIAMCDAWRLSFDAFLADMGPRPQGTTLDRIDNDRGYEKDNCRWVSKKTQSRNVRTNTWIEYRGRRMTVVEASEEAVVDYNTLLWRIGQGWDIEKAMNQPSRNRNRRV